MSDLGREKQRAAGASVLAGALLTVLKLAAGLATGSIGLLAEAAHSALDLGAAAITWLAVRTSSRPPDAEHQYGHGKSENLAALAETVLLIATSVWILHEATERILGDAPEVRPTIWAFLVMGISIAVDVRRSRDLKSVARRSRSQALAADALHFSTDIASSGVVILGLVGVVLSGRLHAPWLAMADPVAAIVVAAVVLGLSWRLGRQAIDVLLDRAPSELRERIERALEEIRGVRGSPRVRVREAGPEIFADVELRLEPGIALVEGERVAARARERVKRITGPDSSVLIQLSADDQAAASLRDRIAVAVSMEGRQAHNISVRSDGEDVWADLHVELPGRLSLSEAHAVADAIEIRILEEVPDLQRVDIHVEEHCEDPEPAEIVDDVQRGNLEVRIREVADRVAGPGAVHDLLIHRASRGIYLSCHCFLPASMSLSEAHALTDRLEAALLREVPGLERVAVHAEPGDQDGGAAG